MEQKTPVNRNMVIVLAVLLVAAVLYFVFSGGFSSMFRSDIPEFGQVTPPSEPATTTAAPPAAAPGAGGSGMSPSIGGISSGPAVPAGPSAAPSGAGGGPVTVAPGLAAEGAEGAGAGKLSAEEKLKKLDAFRKIDSREVLRRRIEEARQGETVVDAEKGLPYPEVGRTDPLFLVSEAIPEELRPPRTGESDVDKAFDELLTKFIQTQILESVRIEVWSVMKIGLTTMVNLSIDGRLGTLPVGYPLNMGAYTLKIVSASQSLVTIVLRSGDISETRSFVPKS